MKINTLKMLIIGLAITGYAQNLSASAFNGIPDSVLMGPGYANDIYYSFEDGIIATVPRANWDIGIYTAVFSATIITNDAASQTGVSLYTYPNSDTAGWATVDTAGMTWTVLYNNEDEWEDGAFNRHAFGQMDYGWGKYNPANHDVVGDSIYILTTANGNYKKVWIERKVSIENKYFIRHANLDGTEDHSIELDINNYRNVEFVYFSFDENSIIEREPDTATWDIQFTKYMAIQPNGTPYPVVGIFNSIGAYANMFYPVAPDFTDYMSLPFDSTKSPIGWEWKAFDWDTSTWKVEDSTVFFIETQKGNIYKLVFTEFEGTGTGNIVFEKEPVSFSGIFDGQEMKSLTVYPNPAGENITLNFGENINGSVMFSIFDISGKQVYSSREEVKGISLMVRLPELQVREGLHLLKVITDDGVYTSKIMIYRH